MLEISTTPLVITAILGVAGVVLPLLDMWRRGAGTRRCTRR